MGAQVGQGRAVPTYSDLLEQYGSNAAIADAAGLTDTRSTARKSLMRSLQRYGKAEQAGATGQVRHADAERMAALSEQLGQPVGERMTAAEAAAAMRARGMTFHRLAGVMDVSSESGRFRDIPGAGRVYFISPDLLTASLAELRGEDDDGGPSFLDLVERGRWTAAVPLFVEAVLVHGYGMPAGTRMGDLTELQFGLPE